ncbi:hypothetical protein GGR54DRAFT_216578 [Hypoxylon sp. NC1633]|nr:hypothetical protein GGR54DRAFT_216578 [Hypoxylon sp. NC1633]
MRPPRSCTYIFTIVLPDVECESFPHPGYYHIQRRRLTRSCFPPTFLQQLHHREFGYYRMQPNMSIFYGSTETKWHRPAVAEVNAAGLLCLSSSRLPFWIHQQGTRFYLSDLLIGRDHYHRGRETFCSDHLTLQSIRHNLQFVESLDQVISVIYPSRFQCP